MKSFLRFIFLTLSIVFWLPRGEANIEDIGPREDLFKVDEILIEGTKKVEPQAILEKIDIRKGMMLDNYMLKRDIESIYRMKFFDSIEAKQRTQNGKKILLFSVREKPIVKSIKLTGNSELDDDELKEQMKVKEFSILDISAIQQDVKNLQKFYEEKGFYLASVHHEIQSLDEENVEVRYVVQEFEKVKVKSIVLLGNRAFDDNQIKSIMETREDSMFSWLTDAGNFKEFNFQTDIERIKFFYKTKGYLQISVGTPQVTISEDKRWVFITIEVNEGPQFKVNDISFEGELLFTTDQLREVIESEEGEVYSEQLIRQDIQKLTEKYQDEGYAFANVLRTLRPIPGENKVDVNFSFEKGKLARFGTITVKGNTKTRDKVIRRELMIHEGMKFSGSKLRESKENVTRLGFFEPNSVVFNTITPEDSNDTLDVEIQVKERNTGQITLGAGYSTATKAFVQASIRQNNFRGLGQTLSLTLNLSSTIQTYTVGFTEPYLFDTRWTAGGDIFRTNDERSTTFQLERTGFDLRVGYPIFDYTRFFLTYKYENTELRNVNDPTVDPAVENGVATGFEATIVHDKRNNTFEPTGGHFQQFSAEYIGLGYRKEWMRLEFDSRYYQNIVGDLVLRGHFVVGKTFQTGAQVPRSEKYFLGGARDMRGYDFDSIGPRKTVAVTDDNGNTSLRSFNDRGLFKVLGTLEFEHPLVREAGLKWVVFADAGNVFREHPGNNDVLGDPDYSLRYDWGFGFRWFSPIGVLRFEFGYPLNKRDDDPSSQFHFDIGQLF